jgi:ORF6N domain
LRIATPSSVELVRAVESKIRFTRGEKVMLDEDLASLYGVEVKVLNQAVRRNIDRFPEDFMFQLSAEEWDSLRSQSVTLEVGRGKFRKYTPYVFTEQGVAMLSSVLNSKQAIAVNIEIMRTFVKLRRIMTSIQTSRANFPRWSASTTPSSRWCSMRSAS